MVFQTRSKTQRRGNSNLECLSPKARLARRSERRFTSRERKEWLGQSRRHPNVGRPSGRGRGANTEELKANVQRSTSNAERRSQKTAHRWKASIALVKRITREGAFGDRSLSMKKRARRFWWGSCLVCLLGLSTATAET